MKNYATMDSAKGFGLVEIMVALVLGLLISLGITQIFIASRGTYVSQSSSARMQEDARFVLSKMTQEIRMAGMYGCLSVDSLVPANGSISKPAAFNTPILWDNATNTLTLITADIGTAGATPTWTIISDCQASTQIYAGVRAPAAGQVAFPLRQLTYRFTGTELTVASGVVNPQAQALLNNINALDISFGITGSPMSYTRIVDAGTAPNIRSVRIGLTLSDPAGKVRNQTYNVVAAVRNRF